MSGYLGSWKIDDLLTFAIVTTRVDTGAATDADSAPAYRVYEDETSTPILTGTMALLDSSNTAGFYSEQITLSAANGFEKGKSYNIYISATVNSVAGATVRNLQIEAEVDANTVSPTVVNANVTQISGDSTSADNLESYTDGTTPMPVNVTQLSGDATAADNSEAFFDGTGYAGTNNVIPTVTTLAGHTPQTGDAYAIVNSGTHGNAAIKGFVDDIGAAGAGLTALPWNAAWDAEVQSEVEDAIIAHRLDELLNADSDIDGAAPPTVGSVFHELMSKTAGSFTYDQTTDSNEALRDRGDAAWTTATGFSTHSAADVWAVGTRELTAFSSSFKTGYALSSAGIQAIWDALTSALTTASSIGKLLVDNINATISSRLASASYTAPLDAAGTRSAVGLASANLDTQLDALPTNAELATALGTADDATLTAIASLSIPTANQNADALLDRAAGVETGVTPRQGLRLMLAAMVGKLSGAASTTVSIRDTGDSKNRIVATVDADGNRSAVTLDGS